MKSAKKAGPAAASVAVWLALSAILVDTALDMLDRLHERQKTSVRELCRSEAVALVNLVEPAYSAAAAFGVLCQVGSLGAEAEAFARDLVERSPLIIRVSVAPGGVVDRVYPSTAPASVLGRDVFADAALGPAALQARLTGRPVANGPFALSEGGYGIAVCAPVYRKDDAGERAFWGFSIAALRLDDLISASGLPKLESAGYNWALSRPNVAPPSTWRNTHLGPPEDLPPSGPFAMSDLPVGPGAVATLVPLPNAVWTLALAPAGGWASERERPLALSLAVLVAMLAAFLLYLLLIRNERLFLAAGELALEVREKEIAQQRLSVLLEEKELLLREIHHRVKNNLAIVESIVSLQAREAEGSRFEQVFDQLSARVHSVSLIHEKLYKGEDLSCVNAELYFRDLVDYLAQGIGTAGAPPEVSIDPCGLATKAALHLGLVATELVTNAVKYGTPGTVKVRLESSDGRLRLTVENQGPALPAGFREGSGLGLRLVDALAAQMDGTWTAESGPPVRVVVDVPSEKALAARPARSVS